MVSEKITNFQTQNFQVEAAYLAFKAKYFSVTLGAIRSELTSNTAFSDVLALEAQLQVTKFWVQIFPW